MKGLFARILFAGAVAGLAGCADAPTTTSAPAAQMQRLPESVYADIWGNASSYSGKGTPNGAPALVKCERHPTYETTADIGPSGGIIRVGRSAVIVPPGALNKTVHITATMPEGEYVTIRFHFEPHGLEFRKPAGLILDAGGCDIPSWYAPDIVYLSDSGEILEYIDSFYSNYWHLVAAPIWHFSNFAIAW